MTSRDQAHRELVDQFKHSGITVVYDVFAETVSTVQGLYIGKMRTARTAEEDGRWTDRAVALREYKNSIDCDDRDAIIDGILRVSQERAQLSGPAASVA